MLSFVNRMDNRTATLISRIKDELNQFQDSITELYINLHSKQKEALKYVTEEKLEQPNCTRLN